MCNPITGSCETQPDNEGGPCNDLIACTNNDVCNDGECIGTDGCPEDQVCNAVTGQCEALTPPAPLPISLGDTWRHFKGTEEPPGDWTDIWFDDVTWEEGPSGFGYEDCPHGTVLNDMRDEYVSFYIRRRFHIGDPGLLPALLLSIDYDDAFVAYINGVEVARNNVDGLPPAFDTRAGDKHECGTTEDFDISLDSDNPLVSGTNVLAIQGHNRNFDDPDFTLNPLLTGTLPPCSTDTDCDDGNPCNGEETCDAAGTCRPGSCASDLVLLQENFDSAEGSFTYQDDTFRGTSAPSHSDGTYEPSGGMTGGGIRVVLGGDDETNMSGGWVAGFSLNGPSASVEVEMAYRLLMDGSYEPDEYAEVLVSVDGTLLGIPPDDYLLRFNGDGAEPPDVMDSGWLTRVFSLALPEGPHEIIMGGYNNKSTAHSEITEIFFDDVKITATLPDQCDCDDGLFCSGAESCDAGQVCVSSGDPCPEGSWCDEPGNECMPLGNGDFELDGDIDLADFAAFQVCFDETGSNGCEPGNIIGSELIDLDDYAMFAAALEGPR